MRLWGFSFMVQRVSKSLGESFNGNKVLTRSCVILNMVVVCVRLLYQYPSVLAVYRHGERWKDSIVSERELVGWFVFVFLCFITLCFDKIFVAVKFPLQSLQVILGLMISCFYAVIQSKLLTKW